MEKNRQLKLWLCMLYPDKELRHKEFIEHITKCTDYDYFYIRHIEKTDEEGNKINESHVHMGIWFINGIRKTTIVNQFGLIKEDEHLFKGLDEFKKRNGQRMFNSIDDYIDYCSHQNNKDKPDKYTFEDFVTNIPERVKNALEKNDRTDYESFNLLLYWLDDEFKKHRDMRLWSKSDVYKYCCEKGYGHLYYKYWNKINYLLNDYITNVL